MSDLLFFLMSALVVNFVALGPESFVAAFFGADEGSGIFMDPAMNLEILFLTESLAAGGEPTLEWLSPVVKMRVCIEAALE